MAKKTFKIGEYCARGVLTVEITGKVILITAKNWDFTTGSRRSSNQSNAEPFSTASVLATEFGCEDKIERYLCSLTTSYYSGKIIEWIKSKIQLS